MLRNLLYIVISFILYFLLNSIFGKSAPTVHDVRNRIFGFISLILAIVLIWGTAYWGTMIPGSFFEREDYHEMLYVYLFPSGQNVKSYFVPAMISASIRSDTYDHGYKEYRIVYATFPQGNKLTFEIHGEDLKLGEKVKMQDDSGRYWDIELTNQAVSNTR